ncbi:hypothetical protein ACHWQZ_G018471 [Mnemiopsis leidyi]
MKNLLCWFKGNKQTGRAAKVLLAICLQGALTYSCSVLSSSFYVTHLVNRGIPKIHVGLIGMIPALGHLINGFYDILDYLVNTRRFSLRAVMLCSMAVVIVNCAGQGVVEYLPRELNTLLTVLMLIFRLVHGLAGFICGKGTVQCCRTWFPDHVNFTVGLEMSMNYLGGGLCILMNGYIYSAQGFSAPFFVVSFICALFWLYNFFVMPRNSAAVFCKDEVNGNKEIRRERLGQDGLTDVEGITTNPAKCDEEGLSWIILLPLFAQSFVALQEGFISAITTPYLHDEFGVEIERGSRIVFFMFVSLIVGSAGAGYILQKGWLSNFRTMIAGGGFSTLGLFLIFPDKRLTALYTAVPKLAYAGSFLVGLGTQLIAIAALPALEETQVYIAQRIYTRKSKSQAGSLWLIFWMLSVYSGHLVALMVMEFLTYSQGGWLMIGCSGMSVFICVALEIIVKTFRKDL